MPAIGRQAVTSARGFGAFTVLSGPFWIGAITQTSTTFITRSITVDNLGNAIVTGNILGTPNYAQIIKISPLGAFVWQKRLTLSATGDVVFDCGCTNYSSSDPILVVTTDSGGYNRIFNVDQSGGLSYQVGYGNGTTTNNVLYSVAPDQNLVVGSRQGATFLEGIFLTYTLNTGSLFYSSEIKTSDNVQLTGVSKDKAPGAKVAVGYAGSGLLVVRAVGNGTLYWQKLLSPPSGGVSWADVVVDSASNAYAVSRISSAIHVSKYDASSTSAGTLLWQRLITLTPTTNFKIAKDAIGNVYCVGTTSSGSAAIFKYTSTGTLVWQRSITNVNAYDIAVDGDVMYVTAQAVISGNSSILVFRLPTNGGLLGTYTVGGLSVTYAASSFTEAAATWTDSTPSFTVGANLSPPVYTPSGAYSNNSATLTVTNI